MQQKPDLGDLALVSPELRPLLELAPRIDLRCEADLANARATMLQIVAAVGEQAAPPPEILREEFVIERPGAANIRLLIHRPAHASHKLPVLLFVHGGGMIGGVPEICNEQMGLIAKRHGCAVIAPDYIKAPEGPWPQGVYDCHAVLEWLEGRSADDVGIEPASLILYGESGGGGIAAGLALYARNMGNRPIDGLALVAPMLDDRTGAEAFAAPHYGRFLWTAEQNATAWSLILRDGTFDEKCPIPGRADDFGSLPQTFLSIGQLDLFFQETLRLVEKLADAAVPVEFHVYPRAYHGFQLAAGTRVAGEAFEALNQFYERVFTAVSI